MRIAGIDADTKNITVFVIDGGLENGWTRVRLEGKGRRAEDRLAELFGHISRTFEQPLFRECNWIYLERPFVGPNPRGALDAGMVVGAIRYALRYEDIRHSLVDPAVWKTNILGTSRVCKEEIKDWAMGRFLLEDNLPQDIYDAACIAAYGLTRWSSGNAERP